MERVSFDDVTVCFSFQQTSGLALDSNVSAQLERGLPDALLLTFFCVFLNLSLLTGNTLRTEKESPGCELRPDCSLLSSQCLFEGRSLGSTSRGSATERYRAARPRASPGG